MKKNLLIVAVISVAILALSLAGFAYAHDRTPSTPEYPYSPGMMNGYSDFGRGMMGWSGEEGEMHDAMIAALADTLGLSAVQIETRHDAGETLWEIAETEGLSVEEIQELMFSAHDVALEDAVANGWLTQEQAEWMDTHMEQMWDGDRHCSGGGYSGISGHRGGMSW
jgi:hypothetical protein